MRLSSYKTYFAALAFLAMLLPFQNCAMEMGGLKSSNAGSSKPANNGEGYTGKPFVNIDVAGTCGTAGGIKALIERSGSRFVQTVKNCAQQPAEDVTAQVDAMEHNLGALLSSTALFERLAEGQSAYSDVLCRGEATRFIEGQRGFADVSMQPTGETITDPGGVVGRVHTGYVKLGSYDVNGALVFKQEFAIKRAVEFPPPNGSNRTFRIESATQGVAFNGPGTEQNYALIVFADNTGSFLFKTATMARPLIVDKMNCGAHGQN